MSTRWIAWSLIAVSAPLICGCAGKPRPRGDTPNEPASRADEPDGRRGPRLASVRGDYSLEQTRDLIRKNLDEMVDRLERSKNPEMATHVQAWAMQSNVHLAASKAREEAGDIAGAIEECYAAARPPMDHEGPGGPNRPDGGMNRGPGPDARRDGGQGPRPGPDARRDGPGGPGGGRDQGREERREMRIIEMRPEGRGEVRPGDREDFESVIIDFNDGGQNRGGDRREVDRARSGMEEQLSRLRREMQEMEKRMGSEEIGQEQRQMMRRRRAELEEAAKRVRQEMERMNRDGREPREREGRDDDREDDRHMMMFEFEGGPDSLGEDHVIRLGPGGDRRAGGPPMPPRPPAPPRQPRDEEFGGLIDRLSEKLDRLGGEWKEEARKGRQENGSERWGELRRHIEETIDRWLDDEGKSPNRGEPRKDLKRGDKNRDGTRRDAAANKGDREEVDDEGEEEDEDEDGDEDEDDGAEEDEGAEDDD